jgi:hypothetical protein
MYVEHLTARFVGLPCKVTIDPTLGLESVDIKNGSETLVIRMDNLDAIADLAHKILAAHQDIQSPRAPVCDGAPEHAEIGGES